MKPDTTASGGQVGATGGEAEQLADRHADDVAALHHVASLAPADPDLRLGHLIEAGCAVVGADRGYVLIRTGSGIVVRAVGGMGTDGPGVGDTVSDRRLDQAMARRSTVAALGGPGAVDDDEPLGAGAMVACPLWVTGRIVGVLAFAHPSAQEPFTAWHLALVDLVADQASRILEHEADIRALVRLESQAQAVIDLMPDPVVRLRRDGQRVDDDLGRPLGPFDPTAPGRSAPATVDPDTIERVQHAVVAALDTGRLQTEVFTTATGGDDRRVEARFVPGHDDAVLCIVRDITASHKAERALAEQVAFEALVASISTRLIGCASHRLDEAIDAGLGEIATFFSADAGFIDELGADGTTLRISHLWSRTGSDPVARRGRRVDLSGFGWLTSRFERDGHVFIRGTHAIPREAIEQALASAGDIGALWVRLGYGGELVGVLGLTWRTSSPPPDDEVLGMVRFAADALLGALRRRSVALLADGQAEVFELIARGAPAATALLAARALLERHTLGATVVIATVEAEGRLSLVSDPEADDEPPFAAWFAALEPGLANPFGQAVVTGEPVMVADAFGDPRYRAPVLPSATFRSATILPIRSPRNGRTLAVVGLLGHDPGAPVAPPAVRDSVRSLVTVAVERSIDERRLAHQATHDPLTGVGNRAALLDRLTLALARARRSGRAVAVLFCDLDSFKAVNDQHGHDRGDRLLVEVADRIGRAVRPSDTVCRTGGDEFVIVCEDLADTEQADTIAERVRTAVESTPIAVGEGWLTMSVSVGVAVADLEIDDPDRLLRTADLAMYARKQERAAARARGGSADRESALRPGATAGHRPPGRPDTDADADPEASQPASGDGERLDRFGRDLADAIASDQLHLVHQPLVGRDGGLAGVEALVRWDHPTFGVVGAERIVSAAAATMAADLGRWVRLRAIADRRRWMGACDGGSSVPLHLNVDRSELATPGLVAVMLEDLDGAGLGPEAIVVEVREHDLVDPDARGVVAAMTAAGIEVLVEGAGQGGLALTDLAGLSVRGLKLGRPLVSQVREDDPLGVEVARSLVLLAHGLGWRSLAVGVETDHHRAVLFGFGVDAVQGRSVSMPLTCDDLVGWLSAPSATGSA